MQRLRALRDLPRLRGSALFDAEWYLATHPDLTQPGARRIDPGLHYLAHGAAEGRDPGPCFSTSGYRLQGWQGKGNPLLHHLDHPGAFAPLPVFAGTGPAAPPDAPVLLFCAHQVQGMQFGAERSFLAMLERAAGAGLGVEVVLPHCLDPGYLAACRDRARTVRLIPYGWRRAGSAPHPATIAALERAIRNSGAREVHQNTLVCDAPLIAARRAGVPGVLHLRELPDEDPGLCARLGLTPEALRDRLLREADRFVANSAATAGWIDPDRALLAGRVVILPNTVDPALFDLPFDPRRPLRVALIGSNIAKKGIVDAREVAREAARRGLDVEILLIGPATPDLAALGPLPANMRHAGYAPDPVAALAQADLVLSLSHFAESYGRTVLEAMAAGRPVIAYARGTPPALIGPEAGRVVPADAPLAVAEALADLLAEPGALMRASQAARAWAHELQAQTATVPDAQLYAGAFGPAAPGP
jgi:glycosyltransferase involved in cell wall biosynthesis